MEGTLFTDLPRTLARIRRLVRENPNDRELQRLLHTLLTSMSADKLDETAISQVLKQMEERCPQSPAPSSSQHSQPNSVASTPTAYAPMRAVMPPSPCGYSGLEISVPSPSEVPSGRCIGTPLSERQNSASKRRAELAHALHGMQAQYAADKALLYERRWPAGYAPLASPRPPPHEPAWRLRGAQTAPALPEHSLSSLEACRGRSSPPRPSPAGPRLHATLDQPRSNRTLCDSHAWALRRAGQ
jgi:hypothetical protein